MSSPTPDKSRSESMVISEEQEKLLHNATRIRILRALNNRSMTAQQVAETLGATKGNVHYHLQRLYEADLLDLVETRPVGGILEKYYRARANLYTVKDDNRNERAAGERRVQQLQTSLTLTEAQLEQLNQELTDLLIRFEELTVPSSDTNSKDYLVRVTVSGPTSSNDENDENDENDKDNAGNDSGNTTHNDEH